MVDLTDEALTELKVSVLTTSGGYMTDAYLRAGGDVSAWLRPMTRLMVDGDVEPSLSLVVHSAEHRLPPEIV
jgi:hypothetical protein